MPQKPVLLGQVKPGARQVQTQLSVSCTTNLNTSPLREEGKAGGEGRS